MANDAEAQYSVIRDQIDTLRNTETRVAIAVRLGVTQRAAVEAYVQQVTGNPDAGPLLSFHGMDVRSSKKNDHVAVLWAEGDDPEDPDAPAPPAETVAPPPEEPPQ